ncbi:MAG: YbjN domain-containing protein [Bacteroidales bacterium]|nr:YbjN domain-containing protein [Bacteroidales bacterium]
MDTSKVLTTLHDLGFQTEEIPGYGHLFQYEGLMFLYMPDEDDEQFFRITLPNIHKFENEDRAFILDIVNEVNNRLKYSKTFATGNDVWISYEQRLGPDADSILEETVDFAIKAVGATVTLFHNLLEGEDESEEANQETEE